MRGASRSSLVERPSLKVATMSYDFGLGKAAYTREGRQNGGLCRWTAGISYGVRYLVRQTFQKPIKEQA